MKNRRQRGAGRGGSRHSKQQAQGAAALGLLELVGLRQAVGLVELVELAADTATRQAAYSGQQKQASGSRIGQYNFGVTASQRVRHPGVATYF